MKKFIIKSLLFVILLFVGDFVIGSVFDSWFAKTTLGTVGRNNYICDLMSEDILVFGSSRARHHYNPKILSDSLGMTCYNLGQDGTGILLSYGRLMMALQRNKPKVVIYDISSYDIEKGDNIVQIHQLKPYYDQVPELTGLFADVDPTEPVKMMSKVYRYNSDYIHNPKSLFRSGAKVAYKADALSGYKPIKGEFDPMKIRKFREEGETPKWDVDSLKLMYLQRFVDKLDKNVFVAFVFSPFWYNRSQYDATLIRVFCKKNEIAFYDFQSDSTFVHNDSLFSDGTHLNSRGADEFSKKIASIIKGKMQAANSDQ